MLDAINNGLTARREVGKKPLLKIANGWFHFHSRSDRHCRTSSLIAIRFDALSGRWAGCQVLSFGESYPIFPSNPWLPQYKPASLTSLFSRSAWFRLDTCGETAHLFQFFGKPTEWRISWRMCSSVYIKGQLGPANLQSSSFVSS